MTGDLSSNCSRGQDELQAGAGRHHRPLQGGDCEKVRDGVVRGGEEASKIRHEDFRPSSVTPGLPPWIMKQGGLKSCGRIPSSSYWKIKRIAFLIYFFSKKVIF